MAVGMIRGALLIITVFGGLALMLILRLVERPIFGQARPVTPYLVQTVCRIALFLLGIRLRVIDKIQPDAKAMVANHSSWLDIFVLNAAMRGYFVSKAEVSKWVGIGWLARATGTVFVERKRGQARAHRDLLAGRFELGHRLIFFPEGTSTDGLRGLPFKSTLFDAVTPGSKPGAKVQPLSVIYRAPAGLDARIYGWWGDMSFAPHLIGLLCTLRNGSVTIMAHEPVCPSDFADRKALALACGQIVAQGHQAVSTGQGSWTDA